MTVTDAMAATAAAGSAKLYDMVTAVPEQTLTPTWWCLRRRW